MYPDAVHSGASVYQQLDEFEACLSKQVKDECPGGEYGDVLGEAVRHWS